MITCPSCGRENANNFNFCLDCGFDLKEHQDVAPTVKLEESALPKIDPMAGVDMDVGDFSNGTLSSTPTPEVHSNVVPSAAPAAQMTAPPGPAAGVQCSNCQAAVPPGNRFCGSCGSPVAVAGETATPQHAAAASTMSFHPEAGPEPAGPQCRLVTIDQTGREGIAFSLALGETICGRTTGTILLADDAFVSPTHCAFNFVGDKLTITDKNSLNGIYVRIPDEHTMVHGDIIRVGRQLLRFESVDTLSLEIQRNEDDDAAIWGSPEQTPFGRIVQLLESGRAGETRLLTGEVSSLGREEGNIVFPTDGFISGRHCTFSPAPNGVIVKDLGSSNGTYVRVKAETTVGTGDFVLIGNQMLRVEIQ